MNNKIIAIIIAAAVIIGGVALLTANTTPGTSTNTASNTTQTAVAKGRVVFSVTDDTMKISNVSAVNVEVTSVAVHNEENGWKTISTIRKNYDLLALNASGQVALLADTSVQAGTYDQIRLTIDSVTLTMKDGTTKSATLPSGELKIQTAFTVNADKTSNINLDFLADKSVHLTGNGKYIFAPVIRTKVKGDAKIEIKTGDILKVTGGRDEEDDTEGMDIDGEFKSNFKIDDNDKLNIDVRGRINRESGD